MDEFDKEAVEWCKHYRLSPKYNAVPLAQFVRRMCASRDKRIFDLRTTIRECLANCGCTEHNDDPCANCKRMEAALSRGGKSGQETGETKPCR